MKLESYMQHIEGLDTPRVMRFQTPLDIDFINYLEKNKKNTDIKVFDGLHLQRWEEFSNAFAAAYKFPYYYGKNLDAFIDVLSDLGWLPKQQNRLIVFKNGGFVLSRETGNKRDIISLLNFVADRWSRPVPNLDPEQWPARPFHVLFHVPKGEKFEKIPSIDFSGTAFA